jgi:hypothetical protein
MRTNALHCVCLGLASKGSFLRLSPTALSRVVLAGNAGTGTKLFKRHPGRHIVPYYAICVPTLAHYAISFFPQIAKLPQDAITVYRSVYCYKSRFANLIQSYLLIHVTFLSRVQVSSLDLVAYCAKDRHLSRQIFVDLQISWLALAKLACEISVSTSSYRRTFSLYLPLNYTHILTTLELSWYKGRSEHVYMFTMGLRPLAIKF